jgi:hypothetical protein
MDGLALLCNLFADGPVTLKRLRLARVANLAELERTPPERLAEWLHASLPQARAFVEEARKLLRRLAEEGSAAPAPRGVARLAAPAPASRESSLPLAPGLLAGLDEALCTRLARHNVRTLQALAEFAGLDLARRTGIPYSTLLELARRARRHLAAEMGSTKVTTATSKASLAEVELLPFLSRPRRAPPETELLPTDEFTLPPAEPESAGPFG